MMRTEMLLPVKGSPLMSAADSTPGTALSCSTT